MWWWPQLALVGVSLLVVSLLAAVVLGRLLRRTNARYPPVMRPTGSRLPEWLRIGGGRG